MMHCFTVLPGLALPMYPTILVPTRNRPKKIAAFLAYLTRFYPGARVVVADGSDPPVQALVGQACADAQGAIDVTFCPYPADLSLFERLLDITQRQQDALLCLSADDDYPVLETMREAARLLHRRPLAAVVVPFSVTLQLHEAGQMKARFVHAANITAPSASKRLMTFSRWRFATSYGVARREALIARYRSMALVYCAGFVDFQIGAEDCLSGRILGLSELGSISTRRFPGAYMRPDDNLIFLRRNAEVLRIIAALAERLALVEQIPPEAAETVVRNAVAHQIAHLTGASPTTQLGFSRSALFLQPVVQDQFAAFYALFQDGTAIRHRFKDRLNHVGRILRSDETVDDQERRGNYELL